MGNRFIIGGDFNAKNIHWASRLNTPRENLKIAIDTEHCDIISGALHTYWPTDKNKIPDLLDFFISKGISQSYFKIVNDQDSLSSDHSILVLKISGQVWLKEKRTHLNQ